MESIKYSNANHQLISSSIDIGNLGKKVSMREIGAAELKLEVKQDYNFDYNKDYSFDEWKVVQENILNSFEAVFDPSVSQVERELLLSHVQPKPATEENYRDFLHMQVIHRGEAAPLPRALEQEFQEMKFRQDMQPVELAVYSNGKMVAFKTEGFTSRNGLESYLPKGWSEMSISNLKSLLSKKLGASFHIVTQADGLSINHKQASEIFNKR